MLNNQLLNQQLLDEILNRYKIKVRNYDNFLLAMTHSSYANEHHLKHNERIEFLGDAILGLLVAEYIYKNFPDMPEGNMTKLRATYVCEDANAKYAREVGIDKLLLLGHGEELSGGRNRQAVLSDAFESFLGAIYLSGSIEEVRKLLEVVAFPHILAIDERQFTDYKSLLQEYIQAETRSAVEYRLENVQGPPHLREFTISVYLDGIRLGRGMGKSKKDAAQAAAADALKKMAKK